MDDKDINRGVLFTEEQSLNENAPAKKGWINVKGAKYRISAWERTSKAGKDYLSISVDSEELDHHKEDK